ncbi:MAG: alpha/beta hydrolase [Sphingomonadales bacterium]|nr:alpha/beta hydrolase [Sphingomonadales bacterium]NCO50346.1 alpha/beta hydrolase [Sphingomonadales bacterium]NCP00972.1 alpha/beta hydrolase [Sphingomonadales bacterium]NCP28101.1 alpha/beta hydrolase [Sphingomonadales bacterium]NCP44039.1 alpha/beta hydrolase [Sphingomonadales bacterium]
MQDDSLDPMIRDAYAIAAQPERVMKLLTLLQKPAAEDEGALQAHFANATELLGEIDNSVGDDFSTYARDLEGPSEQLIPPDLTLSTSMTVLSIDQQLFKGAELKPGQPVPDWLFAMDGESYAQMEKLIKGEGKANPAIVRLYIDQDDDRGILFAAQLAGEAEVELAFRVMRLRWNAAIGSAFAQSLQLTATEQQLAEYLINGQSVLEFAEDRKRALGTARNQLKSLLRKLGIGSQTELIALYAGFSNAFATAELREKHLVPAGSSQKLKLPDGSDLPFELYGDPIATPVLYLHATIDGAYLTARQQDAAAQQNLRVIAPWLPFYAGSKMVSSGLAVVDEFVERLVYLLDRLEIENCAIVSARVAAPYGMAAIRLHPDRFCGLVMAGAILPADDANDFSHLALGYRAPLRLARIAPSFVRLYFAAVSTMVRRGKSMAYFQSIYGDSAADMKTLNRPDVAELMQRSMKRTFEDGYESTAQQAILTASDWSKWCRDLQVPVTVISGAEDRLAPPQLVEQFCDRYDFNLIGPLQDVGSLAIQQVPETIFREAAKIRVG